MRYIRRWKQKYLVDLLKFHDYRVEVYRYLLGVFLGGVALTTFLLNFQNCNFMIGYNL